MKIFAASVSHEMLNPLKCIITFANQLAKPGSDLNKAQICNMISCSARLLQCHTQDLLDQNLLEKGLFALKNSSLGDIRNSMFEISNLMQTQAQMK